MRKLKMSAILTTILACTILPSVAQTPVGTNLYMPLDIRKAYEKGTRSYRGVPGKNYWDNTCRYKISAAIDPATRVLTGREWIEYNNNSPDTLKMICINTYMDVYKRGSERSMGFDRETKGFTLSLVIVDGDTLGERSYRKITTYYEVRPSKPLPPHSSCVIEIGWTVEFVPKAFSREGFVDSTSAFIGYWYPKIAVYDDIYGWEYYTYTMKDEFYSPLSDYDVTISLPEGFIAWATGTLMNPTNYPENVRDRLANISKEPGPMVVIDSTMLPYPKEVGKEAWRFRADSVPDFAFAFSNHFLWVASVPQLNGRKVIVSTVYPKEQASGFGYFNELVRKGMEFYSLEEPGVMFPYPFFTTFYGLTFSGMEFPMMSFEGIFKDPDIDGDIAIHEMLHSYMPFFIRINETRFGWMDEGITSFYSEKAVRKLGFDCDKLYTISRKVYTGLDGSTNLPMLTPTSCLGRVNGGGMQYIKPVDMLKSLEDLVGEEALRQCNQSFTETWKYRSPMTYDFIFYTNRYLKQDLTWFWDAWFMHFGYSDLTVFSVDKDKVIIENTGGLPIPFQLVVTGKNGKQTKTAFHADRWKDGPICEIGLPFPDPVKIELKCDIVEDYDLRGNVWGK